MLQQIEETCSLGAHAAVIVPPTWIIRVRRQQVHTHPPISPKTAFASPLMFIKQKLCQRVSVHVQLYILCIKRRDQCYFLQNLLGPFKTLTGSEMQGQRHYSPGKNEKDIVC